MLKPQTLITDLKQIHDRCYTTAVWMSRSRASSIVWKDNDSLAANILYPLFWLTSGSSQYAGIKIPENRFDAKKYEREMKELYDRFTGECLRLARTDPQKFVTYMGDLGRWELNAQKELDEQIKRVHEHSGIVIEGLEVVKGRVQMIKTACDIALTVGAPYAQGSRLALFFVNTGYGLVTDFIDHTSKNGGKIDIVGFATDQAVGFIQDKATGAVLDSVAGAFKAKFCDKALESANEAYLKYQKTVERFTRQGGNKAQTRQIVDFIDQKTKKLVNGRVTHKQWKVIDTQAKNLQKLLDTANENERIIDSVKTMTGVGVSLFKMREDIGQFGENMGKEIWGDGRVEQISDAA